MALDAVPSSPTFNSYSTVAEADAYHATRLHNTAWTGATTPNKEAALIWATRNLDILEWKGYLTAPAQSHQFPRNMLFRDGGEYGYGSDALYNTMMFDPATVPDFVKQATAELAMYLLTSDVTSPTGTEGFKKIKVDSIEMEIDKKDRLQWMTDSVKNLVWRYLLNNNKYQAAVRRM